MPTYDPGTYHAEIIDQGFAQSAKGTPYFFLTVQIRARSGTGGTRHPCPQYERAVQQYLNTEIGHRILLDDLRAIGANVEDITRLAPESPDYVTLVGREITVECQHEEYAGQMRERWRIARPAKKRMSLDAVRALSLQAGVVPPPPPPAADAS